MLKEYKETSSYHLYKSQQEQDIIPVSLTDYVFKYQRIMSFRDIIVQVVQENPYLLPNDQSLEELQEAFVLYRKLKKEGN